jgi:hypothetical protein
MPVPAHEHATCLHDVQLYSDDAYLLDSLTTFVGREITKGNSAIVIATKEHRDGLAERLARQHPDLCLAVEQGRYIALDAADTLSKFMVNGTPDPILFSELIGATVSRAAAAVRGEHSRVAAYGEMVSLLWAEGEYEAVVRLEQLWNDLGKTHSFALRCGYPLKGFDRKDHIDLFLKVCTEHSAVIPDESFTKLADEKERLRTVASLQQREQALATEVAEFRTMSAQTVEVQNRNVELIEEVKKRETAEDELRSYPAIARFPGYGTATRSPRTARKCSSVAGGARNEPECFARRKGRTQPPRRRCRSAQYLVNPKCAAGSTQTFACAASTDAR